MSQTGAVPHILRRRHLLEAVITLLLAGVAVLLEVLHVEDVFGREPFRILLPALCALIAITLLELVAVVKELQSTAADLVAAQRSLNEARAGEDHLTRLATQLERPMSVKRESP